VHDVPGEDVDHDVEVVEGPISGAAQLGDVRVPRAQEERCRNEVGASLNAVLRE